MASLIPTDALNTIAGGLSNAGDNGPTQLPEITVTPGPESTTPGSSTDPNSVIPNSTSSGGGTLQYPQDLPQYYIQLDVYKYSRASWSSVGSLTPDGVVALPVPIQIFDAITIEFEKKPLYAFGALWNAYNAVNKPIDSNFISGLASGATGGEVVGSVGGQAFRRAATSAAGAAGQAGVDALGAAIGAAINNYLTVMLKGPTYKQHKFNWRFSPRNENESKRLSEISLYLRESSAPGITSSAGSAFFTYPKIVIPSFRYQGQGNPGLFMYFFKPCFLEKLTFNYTPNGTAAFYAKTQAIEGFEMGMLLQEIEYWLAGSYKNAVDNALPGGGTSSTAPIPGQFGPNTQAVINSIVEKGNQLATAAKNLLTNGSTPGL